MKSFSLGLFFFVCSAWSFSPTYPVANNVDWINPASWTTGSLPTLTSDVIINGSTTLLLSGTGNPKTISLSSFAQLAYTTASASLGFSVNPISITMFDNSVLNMSLAQSLAIQGTGGQIVIAGAQARVIGAGPTFQAFSTPLVFNYTSSNVVPILRDINMNAQFDATLAPMNMGVLIEGNVAWAQNAVPTGDFAPASFLTIGVQSGIAATWTLASSSIFTCNVCGLASKGSLTIAGSTSPTYTLASVSATPGAVIKLSGFLTLIANSFAGSIQSDGNAYILLSANTSFNNVMINSTVTSNVIRMNVPYTITNVGTQSSQFLQRIQVGATAVLTIADARGYAASSLDPCYFEGFDFPSTGSIAFTGSQVIAANGLASVQPPADAPVLIRIVKSRTTGLTANIQNVGTVDWTSNPNLRFEFLDVQLSGGSITAFISMPPQSVFRALAAINPSSVTMVEPGSFGGSILFTLVDVTTSTYMTLGTNLPGSATLRGSNLQFGPGCVVASAPQDANTDARSLGTFTLDATAPSALEIPFSTCQTTNTSAINYIFTSQYPVVFNIRPGFLGFSIQVSKNATLYVNGNIFVRSAFYGQNPPYPVLNNNYAITPDLVIQDTAKFVIQNGVANVMRQLAIPATGVLRVIGAGSAVIAADIAANQASCMVSLEWDPTTCILPSTANFPSLIANAGFCPFSSCIVSVTGISTINMSLNLGGVPFKGNVTFASVPYSTNVPSFASVTFVNTAGLTYAWATKTRTALVGSNMVSFADYYFYSTSVNVPGYYGCNPNCQIVEISPGYFVNTCDPPQALVVTSSGTIAITGSLSATSLTLSNNTDLVFSPGSSLQVSGTLTINAGSDVVFNAQKVGTIGGQLILNGVATLTINAGSSLQVTGTITLSPQGQLIVQPQSGVVLVGQQALQISGALIIQLTSAFFSRSDSSRQQLIGRGTSSASQTQTVATYSSSSGTFSSATTTVGNYSTSQCDTVSSTQPNYGSSSLTVTVTVTRNNDLPGCASSSSGGLSTGAIVGIAVGSAVGVTLIVILLILLIRRHEIAKTNEMFLKRVRSENQDL